MSYFPCRYTDRRYGLIVEEIILDMGAPLQASISDSDPLMFAGKAQVLYSIGPRYVETDRRIFRHSSVQGRVGERTETSLWDSVRLPKEGFAGHITPVNWHTMMLGGDTSKAGLKATIQQKEGYYRLSQEMTLAGDTSAMIHDFRVPLYRFLTLGRTFDEAFHVEKTSLHGIAIGGGVGVDFHYRNKEQRYEAGMTRSQNGHAFGLSHLGEGTGTSPDSIAAKRVESYMAEQYRLQYQVDF